MEVRGDVEQLWWSSDGVGGDVAAVERLHHVATSEPADPVGFLVAVRTAFGDHVAAHFADLG